MILRGFKLSKDYNFHKQPENKKEYEIWMKKLNEQTQQAESSDIINCICGQDWEMQYLYRCYFCGLWLCSACAKKHFGKRQSGVYTYKDYFKEK